MRLDTHGSKIVLLFFLNFRVTEETRCCSYRQSGIFTLHRTFSAQCREWQNTCTRVKGVIMLAFNLCLSCSCLLSLCKPARTNSTAHNQLFRTMEKAFWTNSHRAHISWIWIFPSLSRGYERSWTRRKISPRFPFVKFCPVHQHKLLEVPV